MVLRIFFKKWDTHLVTTVPRLNFSTHLKIIVYSPNSIRACYSDETFCVVSGNARSQTPSFIFNKSQNEDGAESRISLKPLVRYLQESRWWRKSTSWNASGFPGLKREGSFSSNPRTISGQTEFTKKSYPGTLLPFSLEEKSNTSGRSILPSDLQGQSPTVAF